MNKILFSFFYQKNPSPFVHLSVNKSVFTILLSHLCAYSITSTRRTCLCFLSFRLVSAFASLSLAPSLSLWLSLALSGSLSLSLALWLSGSLSLSLWLSLALSLSGSLALWLSLSLSLWLSLALSLFLHWTNPNMFLAMFKRTQRYVVFHYHHHCFFLSTPWRRIWHTIIKNYKYHTSLHYSNITLFTLLDCYWTRGSIWEWKLHFWWWCQRKRYLWEEIPYDIL